jgi:hypothetical protein
MLSMFKYIYCHLTSELQLFECTAWCTKIDISFDSILRLGSKSYLPGLCTSVSGTLAHKTKILMGRKPHWLCRLNMIWFLSQKN